MGQQGLVITAAARSQESIACFFGRFRWGEMMSEPNPPTSLIGVFKFCWYTQPKPLSSLFGKCLCPSFHDPKTIVSEDMRVIPNLEQFGSNFNISNTPNPSPGPITHHLSSPKGLDAHIVWVVAHLNGIELVGVFQAWCRAPPHEYGWDFLAIT